MGERYRAGTGGKSQAIDAAISSRSAKDRAPGSWRLPDAKLVATASRDTTVRLWAADIRAAGDDYACEACGPIEEVLKLAKKRVTRKLTPYEEQQYLGRSSER